MFKRINILVFVIISLSILYSFAQVNLVKNPGFENWENGSLEDWEINSAEPNAVSRSLESYSGNCSIKISHKKKTSYSWVRQAISVEPNTSYDAYLTVRGENIQIADNGQGGKLFLGEYPIANAFKTSSSCEGNFGWVKIFTARFNTGPRQKIWLYAYLHNASGTFWVDDVMLTIADDSLRDASSRRRNRVLADLQTVQKNIELLEGKQGFALEDLKAEGVSLKNQINDYAFEEDFDYTKSPPYNNLHNSVYVLNSKVLSKIHSEEFLVWSDGQWSPLNPLQLPSNTDKLCLSEDLMLNEWGSAAFNITNPTASQQTVSISLGNFMDEGVIFPEERIVLREVVFVESITSQMQPDALRKIKKGKEEQFLISIPAGATAQVWLQINGKGFQQAGKYEGIINISNGRHQEKGYLALRFWPLTFPEVNTLHGYNWSYLSWPILVGREEEAVRDLFAHYTDTFVIHYPYLPWPTVDQEGNIISMDFSKFDQQLDYHRGAKMFILWFTFEDATFQQMKTPFEYMSPQWKKVFTQWINNIVDHLEARGITKAQFAFYPVDEPLFSPTDRKHQLFIQVASEIKSMDPQLLIYINPIGSYHAEGLASIAQVADIICPQLGSFIPEVSRVLQATGRTIWTFQTTGAGKNLSPVGYYRMNPWGAWLNGCKGCGFWSYADIGWPGSPFGKSAWDDFDSQNADYAVIYESQEELVPSKRWEAWREGFEDYEYLVMLERELKRLDSNMDPNVSLARSFLQEVPQRVFEARDPVLIQAARLRILELLSKLGKLH